MAGESVIGGFFRDDNAWMCAGLVSQQPPTMVAPALTKTRAMSLKRSAVRSFRCPRNSFGLPEVVLLNVFVYPFFGLVVLNALILNPNGIPNELISARLAS